MSKVFGPLATVSKLIPKIYSMMLPFLSIGLGLFIQFSMWLAAIGVGLILLVKIIREGGFMEIFRNINKAFKEISENSLKNILFYTEDPIVSIDVNNSYYSCTFDSLMTSVIGKMVKIIGWYDNETGYSSRIIDLINLIQTKSYI